MKKKNTSLNNKSTKTTILHQSSTKIQSKMQSFWFRLWIGFLIGANAAFAIMTLLVMLNKNLKITLPTYQGVTFIVLGFVDIWFMIRLLRWKRCGLYGTLLVTVLSMILNISWGADVFTSVMYALIPAALTLAFVIPQWSNYK